MWAFVCVQQGPGQIFCFPPKQAHCLIRYLCAKVGRAATERHDALILERVYGNFDIGIGLFHHASLTSKPRNRPAAIDVLLRPYVAHDTC